MQRRPSHFAASCSSGEPTPSTWKGGVASLQRLFEERQGSKVAARRALVEATESLEISAMNSAIVNAIASGFTGGERELCNARAALARERGKKSARRALFAASGKQAVVQLREAIRRGESAGLSDEELQPSRDELNVARQQAAMQMLQEAIRVRDVSALTAAIEAAETVSLEEEALSEARVSLTRARALRSLQNATERSDVDALQSAIDAAEQVGLPDEDIVSAKTALRDVRRRTALHGILEAIQNGLVVPLQEAIDEGGRVGLSQDELVSARRSLAARRGPAVELLSDTVRSRDTAALQVAIEQGVAIGLAEKDLAVARRALAHEGRLRLQAAAEAAAVAARSSSVLVWKDACSICFEEGRIAPMACCGRDDSTMRICDSCSTRVGRCPFCRAPIQRETVAMSRTVTVEEDHAGSNVDTARRAALSGS